MVKPICPAESREMFEITLKQVAITSPEIKNPVPLNCALRDMILTQLFLDAFTTSALMACWPCTAAVEKNSSMINADLNNQIYRKRKINSSFS